MQLAAIERECFSTPCSEKKLLEEYHNDSIYYILARDEDNVVGYASYQKVADEGQIANIAVTKNYRRMRIASSLLKNILQHGEKNGISVFNLEVREGNSAAIQLYLGMNFKKVGYRKNYYTNPTEGAILLDLIIKE